MVKLAETILRSTKPSIAYSPCYKLAAFDGFQFVANVFWQLAYNVAYCRSKGIGTTAVFNEKQMITNYSSVQQRLSSPYFGNTFVGRSLSQL